jgi:hypothetical protein
VKVATFIFYLKIKLASAPSYVHLIETSTLVKCRVLNDLYYIDHRESESERSLYTFAQFVLPFLSVDGAMCHTLVIKRSARDVFQFRLPWCNGQHTQLITQRNLDQS